MVVVLGFAQHLLTRHRDHFYLLDLPGRCLHESILRTTSRSIQALVHSMLSLSCRRLSAACPPMSRVRSTRLLVTRSSRTLQGPNFAHSSARFQGAARA